MSLWAEYALERLGHQAIELEHGFVTYEVNGRDCFIVDFFVSKEARGTGMTTVLLDRLFEAARNQDCAIVSAHVWPGVRGAEHALAIALKKGFRLYPVPGSTAVGIVKDLDRT